MRKTILLVVLSVMALPAFADVTIDFGTGVAGSGGLFTLTGPNQATGAAIPIGVVTISGAPLNNGPFAVTGACLGFGCLTFDTTANTVSIVGGIPGLGIASETLLTGSFTSFTADGNGLTNATGPDSKAANLLGDVGVPADVFSFFGFSLTTTPGGVPGPVISSDFRNAGVAPVPEPSSVVLFGTVLLVLCAAARRMGFVKP